MRGDADSRAGFGERNVSSQKRALLHGSHCHVQGIQGVERDGESREPFAGLCKMGAFQCQSHVNSLLQMGLKESKHAVPLRRAHFASAHFAGERGGQFRFYEPANCPLSFFVQRSLRRTA